MTKLSLSRPISKKKNLKEMSRDKLKARARVKGDMPRKGAAAGASSGGSGGGGGGMKIPKKSRYISRSYILLQ